VDFSENLVAPGIEPGPVDSKGPLTTSPQRRSGGELVSIINAEARRKETTKKTKTLESGFNSPAFKGESSAVAEQSRLCSSQSGQCVSEPYRGSNSTQV
jgi:hypothetical protein